MRKHGIVNAIGFATFLIGSAAQAQVTPLYLAQKGCELQPMKNCGNQLQCAVIEDLSPDVPDPVNPANIVSVGQWASDCYYSYVKNIDGNDASKANSDQVAETYNNITKINEDPTKAVFVVVFFNPTSTPISDTIFYAGTKEPLDSGDQTSTRYPRSEYVSSETNAIFKKVYNDYTYVRNLQASIQVTVSPNSYQLLLLSPSKPTNPQHGFYGAALFSGDSNGQLFIDQGQMIAVAAFRWVDEPNMPTGNQPLPPIQTVAPPQPTLVSQAPLGSNGPVAGQPMQPPTPPFNPPPLFLTTPTGPIPFKFVGQVILANPIVVMTPSGPVPLQNNSVVQVAFGNASTGVVLGARAPVSLVPGPLFLPAGPGLPPGPVPPGQVILMNSANGGILLTGIAQFMAGPGGIQVSDHNGNIIPVTNSGLVILENGGAILMQP